MSVKFELSCTITLTLSVCGPINEFISRYHTDTYCDFIMDLSVHHCCYYAHWIMNYTCSIKEAISFVLLITMCLKHVSSTVLLGNTLSWKFAPISSDTLSHIAQ